MAWVGIVETAACLPFVPIIAMRRDAARSAEHPSHMHKIPSHESGVSLGKIIVEPRAIVAVTWAWTGFPNPPSVGLRGDNVA